MTTYKDIRGTHITTVTADPPSPVNGQMWYNSTDQVMKGFTSNPAGTWSTTGSLNQSREGLAAAGQAPKDTGLVFAGFDNPTKYANTELFNGSSWTELNDMNTARTNCGGFGISTAAVAAGGYDGPPGAVTTVETWNGSSWTNATALPAKGYTMGSAGTSTSGLIFGGITTPPFSVLSENTKSWNGSAWTELSDLNTDRYSLGGTGATGTAALASTGNNGSGTQTATESWNGSSWTEVNDVNTARQGVSNAGIYTDALIAAGGPATPALFANTELWNGTSWTETSDMNNAVDQSDGGGSTSAAISAGGELPGVTNQAEAWVAPTTSTVTFTAS